MEETFIKYFFIGNVIKNLSIFEYINTNSPQTIFEAKQIFNQFIETKRIFSEQVKIKSNDKFYYILVNDLSNFYIIYVDNIISLSTAYEILEKVDYYYNQNILEGNKDKNLIRELQQNEQRNVSIIINNYELKYKKKVQNKKSARTNATKTTMPDSNRTNTLKMQTPLTINDNNLNNNMNNNNNKGNIDLLGFQDQSPNNNNNNNTDNNNNNVNNNNNLLDFGGNNNSNTNYQNNQSQQKSGNDILDLFGNNNSQNNNNQNDGSNNNPYNNIFLAISDGTNQQPTFDQNNLAFMGLNNNMNNNNTNNNMNMMNNNFNNLQNQQMNQGLNQSNNNNGNNQQSNNLNIDLLNF